jgi:hypothetical protein
MCLFRYFHAQPIVNSRLISGGRVCLAGFIVLSGLHPLGEAPVEFRDDLLKVFVEISLRLFGPGSGASAARFAPSATFSRCITLCLLVARVAAAALAPDCMICPSASLNHSPMSSTRSGIILDAIPPIIVSNTSGPPWKPNRRYRNPRWSPGHDAILVRRLVLGRAQNNLCDRARVLYPIPNIEKELLVVTDRFGFGGEPLSDLVEWPAREELGLEDLAPLSVRMVVQHVGLIHMRPFKKRSVPLLLIVAGCDVGKEKQAIRPHVVVVVRPW